jgi:hypothetical protein
MVINGVLSDVTRVSTEVTDEVIVTAVEAGESARKVAQLLMLLFVCMAGFFLMTLVSTGLRSIWEAVQSAHIRWKCSQYWWQQGWQLSSRGMRMSRNAWRIGLEQQVS